MVFIIKSKAVLKIFTIVYMNLIYILFFFISFSLIFKTVFYFT